MKRATDLLEISTPKRHKNLKNSVDPEEIARQALDLLLQLEDEPSVPYPLLVRLFEKSQDLLSSKGHAITKFIGTDVWDLIITYSLPENLNKALRILGSLALVCTGWKGLTNQIFARIGFNSKTDSDFNLVRFPELTSLSLQSSSKITMRSLSTLANLASLDLGTNFQAPLDLARLPQLRDLYVGDNCILKLCHLPNLRRLHFDDRADFGVPSLSKLAQLLPNLNEFRPGNAFNSEDLLHLSLLTCLTRLELGRPKRPQSPVFPAIFLSTLKFLCVNNSCPEQSIEIQTNLTHLDHASSGSSGAHYYTTALTNLVHLSTDLAVTYPNESYLMDLPSLTSLNLRDYYRTLNSLTNLKKLTLHAFNEIACLTQLTHLSFDHQGILSTLDKLPNLKHIRVNHVEAMGVVSSLTQLQSLVLTNCRDICDEVVQPLVALRCLRLEPFLGNHSLSPKSLVHLEKLVEFQLIPVDQEITTYFRKQRRAVKLYDYPYLGIEYDF